MARKKNAARRMSARQAAGRSEESAPRTTDAARDDRVAWSPPTSPTSEPFERITDQRISDDRRDEERRDDIVFGSLLLDGMEDQLPKDHHQEQTDWQALLSTLSGNSMFEDTPEKTLGEELRNIANLVTPFMSKEMQAMWGPPNAGWIPQRPVSPPNHQQEQERLYQQQQEEEEEKKRLQQQMLLQQQYFFYQQQQFQQQQFYYQQQVLMMPPPPVMAHPQFSLAAAAGA